MLDALPRPPRDGHDRKPIAVAHTATRAARSDRRYTRYRAAVTEQRGVPALSAETHVASASARPGDRAYESRVFRSGAALLLARRPLARAGGDDSSCADRAGCESCDTGVRAP